MYSSKWIAPLLSLRRFPVITAALLGVMLVGLSACNLPSPEKVAIDDTASYYVSSSEGRFTLTTNHRNISIPLSRTMNLVACLRENSRSLEILNHTFVVRGGATEQTILTDSHGCLIWEEELKFNYLANEEFITIRRTLHPEGHQQGDRAVEFIVNPWQARILSSIDTVIKEAVPFEKSTLSLMGTQQKDMRSLWLDWVRLNTMQENISHNRGTYNIEVSATVMVERLDDKHDRLLLPLTYGNVVGRIQLICVMHPDQRDSMKVVIAQMDNIKATIVNGSKFFLNSRFTLTEYCPTTAFLMAGISVGVPDSPDLLVPFHGLFHGGPAQGIVGPMFAVPDGTFVDRFMKDRTYTVGKFLHENKAIYRNSTAPLMPFTTTGQFANQIDPTEPNPQAPDKPAGWDDNENTPTDSTPDFLQRFRIEVRELIPMMYGFQQQYYKTRKLTFRTRACMRLGIDQTAIRSITFQISKMNGTSEFVTTMDDGCLEWEDSVTYNHFARECWSEKHVRIRNRDYGFDQTFKIHVNPWSRNSQWFKDVRWLPQGDRKLRCMESPSQILFAGYALDYSQGRYFYELDPYMALSQSRRANISIHPQLKRGAFDASTGYVTENLPAGRYLIRFALIDQSVTDYANAAALKNRIYSVNRALVTIREDGAVVDQLNFLINNESLISLGLLNQFIIEMMPVKEGVTLAPTLSGEELENFVDTDHAIQVVPFVAQFVHRLEGGGLRKLDQFAGKSLVLELEKQFKAERQAFTAVLKKASTKESFAQMNSLKVVNLADPKTTEKLRLDLANSLLKPFRFRTETTPIPHSDLTNILKTGQIDHTTALRICGYILKTLWTEKLPGKDHGYLNIQNEDDIESVAYGAQHECVKAYSESPMKGFDLEYSYILQNPELEKTSVCNMNAKGQNECVDDVLPRRVDIRTLVISNTYSVSRHFGFAEGVQAEGEIGASISKILGIGIGLGYQIEAGTDNGETNSVSFYQDMQIAIETVQLNIKAQNAERCLMIRLNPVLFDEEVDGFWFSKQPSIFVRSMHPDLTDQQRYELRRKGLLLCDGAPMNKPVSFTESFYLVRPNSPAGVFGDEKSRANVEGLFATLRGVNDMTAFVALVTNSEKIPDSFSREYQSRKLDTTKLREAILRGSKALPGVYSTVTPL